MPASRRDSSAGAEVASSPSRVARVRLGVVDREGREGDDLLGREGRRRHQSRRHRRVAGPSAPAGGTVPWPVDALWGETATTAPSASRSWASFLARGSARLALARSRRPASSAPITTASSRRKRIARARPSRSRPSGERSRGRSMNTSYVRSRQVDHDDTAWSVVGIRHLDTTGRHRRTPVRVVERELQRNRLPFAVSRITVFVLDDAVACGMARIDDCFPPRTQDFMSITPLPDGAPRSGLARRIMVTYGSVMRERSRSAVAGRAPSRGSDSGRPTKLRFRASHNRIAPLRISHHGSLWQPPVKDADREEVAPPKRKKK